LPHAVLGERQRRAAVEVLADLDAYPPIAQDDAASTHAPKVDKAEARIDWTQEAEAIERLVRGLAPFPGAWFEIGEERVKLLMAEVVEGSGAPGEVLDTNFAIACGPGALRPVTLQRAGKPAMSLEDYLRGRPVEAETILV
ncbi:MAG: methionyl-tRNA formyltransferase, partial [Pseudomonadota bacterium]